MNDSIDTSEALRETLIALRREEQNIYLVVDASRSPDTAVILQALDDNALCLFDGQAREDLAEVAPWIVPIDPQNSDVLNWFLDEAWGQDTGLFLFSKATVTKVKTSLKRSFRVQDDAGRNLFFKIYRPSVFSSYLPMMEPDQIAFVMRDFDRVLTEIPADPDVMNSYAAPDGTLIQEVLNSREVAATGTQAA